MGAGASIDRYEDLPVEMTRDEALAASLRFQFIDDPSDFPEEYWESHKSCPSAASDGEPVISREAFINLYEELVREDIDSRKRSALIDLNAQSREGREGDEAGVDGMPSLVETEHGDEYKPSSPREDLDDLFAPGDFAEDDDAEIFAQDGEAETSLDAELGHGTFEEPEDGLEGLAIGDVPEMILPGMSVTGKGVKGKIQQQQQSEEQPVPYDPAAEGADDEVFAADGEAFEGSTGPGIFNEGTLLKPEESRKCGLGLAVIGTSPKR